ncbi:Hypothetical predicted protein [Mytilus galloprovincialis]|uniref:Uncharacterized protein n=1 Tax=Mytilus galloprovincialis TaxID=29158 RepID=A0A8B6CQ63_MYTGA|nr:Hypothetical predicted protein [Mytilus galloprovincialis]
MIQQGAPFFYVRYSSRHEDARFSLYILRNNSVYNLIVGLCSAFQRYWWSIVESSYMLDLDRKLKVLCLENNITFPMFLRVYAVCQSTNPGSIGIIGVIEKQRTSPTDCISLWYELQRSGLLRMELFSDICFLLSAHYDELPLIRSVIAGIDSK